MNPPASTAVSSAIRLLRAFVDYDLDEKPSRGDLRTWAELVLDDRDERVALVERARDGLRRATTERDSWHAQVKNREWAIERLQTTNAELREQLRTERMTRDADWQDQLDAANDMSRELRAEVARLRALVPCAHGVAPVVARARTHMLAAAEALDELDAESARGVATLDEVRDRRISAPFNPADWTVTLGAGAQ